MKHLGVLLSTWNEKRVALCDSRICAYEHLTHTDRDVTCKRCLRRLHRNRTEHWLVSWGI